MLAVMKILCLIQLHVPDCVKSGLMNYVKCKYAMTEY